MLKTLQCGEKGAQRPDNPMAGVHHLREEVRVDGPGTTVRFSLII
jgi:hypothetical protein